VIVPPSQLGPFAAHQQVSSAANATNAIYASNANTTNGMHLAKSNFVGGDNTPADRFSADGLTLSTEYDGSAEMNFVATTSVDNAEIYESGNFNDTFTGGFNSDFDTGEVEEVGEEIGDATQNEVQGQLVYSTLSVQWSRFNFSLDDDHTRAAGF
jgi:hypothetical protein